MAATLSKPLNPIECPPESPLPNFRLIAYVRGVLHRPAETRILTDNGKIFQEFVIKSDVARWIQENDRIEIETTDGQAKIKLVSRSESK